MSRWYTRFGDGGRGLAAIGMARTIQVGVSPSWLRREDGKFFDRRTGQEIKPISLAEFLREPTPRKEGEELGKGESE